MSIRYVGHLPGSAINIGAQLGLVAGLQGQLTVLQGRLANMSAQLSLVLKVQIPDPVTLTAGLQAALAGVPRRHRVAHLRAHPARPLGYSSIRIRRLGRVGHAALAAGPVVPGAAAVSEIVISGLRGV